MVDIADNPKAVLDAEETPQSRQRKKVAKQTAERKAIASKPKEEWFEVSHGKLLKVVVSGTGNVHRTYQCNADKKNKDYIADLKKKGLIRA